MSDFFFSLADREHRDLNPDSRLKITVSTVTVHVQYMVLCSFCQFLVYEGKRKIHFFDAFFFSLLTWLIIWDVD